LACLALTACDGIDTKTPEPVPLADLPAPTPTILDVAIEAGDFTTLIAAIDAAGLTSTIDDASATLTVFAPTDAAFALLGEAAINDLLADPDTLSDILLYHVVSGTALDSAAATDAVGTTVEMANGDRVGVSAKNDSLFLNLSKVTATDIQADNGVIHVIDAVLMPPADATPSESTIVNIAAADERFTTLVAALGATGLDTVLASETDTFTVFAPTNAAFEAMGSANLTALLADLDNLTDILQQHVITDAAVDAVTACSLSGNAATTVGGAEVPISISSKRELRVGGADKSCTVFAPTDAAFAKLGTDAINGLLADPAALADILLYHVFADAVVLADGAISVAASDQSILEMANATAEKSDGRTALSLSDTGLTVNLASVTSANVMASFMLSTKSCCHRLRKAMSQRILLILPSLQEPLRLY
jgi:transforming growth factor-beta-induced protein